MEQRRIKKERERERHPCLRVPAREIVPFRILFFWGRRIIVLICNFYAINVLITRVEETKILLFGESCYIVVVFFFFVD